jgi:hypothetical protein
MAVPDLPLPPAAGAVLSVVVVGVVVVVVVGAVVVGCVVVGCVVVDFGAGVACVRVGAVRVRPVAGGAATCLTFTGFVACARL